jgi:hypothetical protein
LFFVEIHPNYPSPSLKLLIPITLYDCVVRKKHIETAKGSMAYPSSIWGLGFGQRNPPQY